MTETPQNWYIVLQPNGQCAIVPASADENQPSEEQADVKQWGPYPSQQEAIARRVGLIRAGKCKPA